MAEEPTRGREEEEEERSGTYMDYEPSTDPLVKETARKVRRVGYIVAVILIIWLNAPIIIGVVSGAIAGEVKDPYSERDIDPKDRESDCEKWGFELLQAAPSAERDTQRGTWTQRCSAQNPEIAARFK